MALPREEVKEEDEERLLVLGAVLSWFCSAALSMRSRTCGGISLEYLDSDLLIVREPTGGSNYQVFTRRAGPARPGKRGFMLDEV